MAENLTHLWTLDFLSLQASPNPHGDTFRPSQGTLSNQFTSFNLGWAGELSGW